MGSSTRLDPRLSREQERVPLDEGMHAELWRKDAGSRVDAVALLLVVLLLLFAPILFDLGLWLQAR